MMTERYEHVGGDYPGHPLDQIVPTYRGPERLNIGIRVKCAPAKRLDWSLDGGPDDIVAYEIVHKVRN